MAGALVAVSAGGVSLYMRAVEDHTKEVQASIVTTEPSDWTDVVAIAAGRNHSLGVHRDGTVVAAGGNTYGQCNVSDWTGIVAVSAYNHSIGLRSDGTAVATGNNEHGQCNVSGWSDVVAVAAGNDYSVGVRSDGTVLLSGDLPMHVDKQALMSLTGLIGIAASGWHVIGLRSDGTAVALGAKRDGECDVETWTDLVALSAGDSISLGLRSDGTAVVAGDERIYQARPDNHSWKSSRELDVTQWTELVAIATEGNVCVGLRSDGTAYAAGYTNSAHQGIERLLEWTDLSAIAVGNETVMGLKKDGSVNVVGRYQRSDKNWVSAVPGEA